MTGVSLSELHSKFPLKKHWNRLVALQPGACTSVVRSLSIARDENRSSHIQRSHPFTLQLFHLSPELVSFVRLFFFLSCC